MNSDSKTQSCGKTLILLLETKVDVEIFQQGNKEVGIKKLLRQRMSYTYFYFYFFTD
jgi:hypothetical protein